MERWANNYFKIYRRKPGIYILTATDELIGFYAFKPKNQKVVILDFMFIEPVYIGKGYGKILMNDFFQRVKKMEFEKIILDADPNAERFYERNGFKVTGKLKSSIKDRFLPIMEMKIKPDPNL